MSVGTQIATREATPRFRHQARLTALFRSEYLPIETARPPETTEAVLPFARVRPPVLLPQPILRKTPVRKLPELAILPISPRFPLPIGASVRVVAVVRAQSRATDRCSDVTAASGPKPVVSDFAVERVSPASTQARA